MGVCPCGTQTTVILNDGSLKLCLHCTVDPDQYPDTNPLHAWSGVLQPGLIGLSPHPDVDSYLNKDTNSNPDMLRQHYTIWIEPGYWSGSAVQWLKCPRR